MDNGSSPAASSLPDHWTTDAVDLFEVLIEERPGLAADEVAALAQACELISTADRLDEVARAAGYVSTGSQGQTVIHPATPEARQARQAVGVIVRGLRAPATGPRQTASERGQAAARARWGAGGRWRSA